MTTITLFDYVKATTGFAESTITTVTSSIISFLSTSLREFDTVKVEGLGIFKVVDRPEREGRNPRTGEQTTFKASRKVKFTPSKSFGVLILPDPKAQLEFFSSNVSETPETPEDISEDISREFSEEIPLELLPGYIPVPVSIPVPVPISNPVPVSIPLVVEAEVPPIPLELLPEVATDKIWNIKAPDSSFVKVFSQDLTKWGVTMTTPVYSPDTGWILASNVPELAGLLG
jgi:Bacterial nucleoid DNA-binding protein